MTAGRVGARFDRFGLGQYVILNEARLGEQSEESLFEQAEGEGVRRDSSFRGLHSE